LFINFSPCEKKIKRASKFDDESTKLYRNSFLYFNADIGQKICIESRIGTQTIQSRH